MPLSAEDIRQFLLDYEGKFTSAIDAYYDDLAQAAAPKTGLAKLFAGINQSLTGMIARQTIAETLRNIITEMHLRAAVMGNDGNPIDFGQHAGALDAIRDQMDYLNGFLKDLPDLSRKEAEHRLMKYLSSGVQTISDSAVRHLPLLPHYPGDYDLACHGFCRCHLVVERVGPNSWGVYWELDPTGVEHCVDCVYLAKNWSPLEIRDGVILQTKAKRDAISHD